MQYCIRTCICALVFSIAFSAHSQDSSGIHFNVQQRRINDRELMVTIYALLPTGVELFDVKKNDKDVLYSTIQFDSSLNKKLVSSLRENINSKNKIDSSTKSNVAYFTYSASWQQVLNANAGDSFTIKGTISYLYKKGSAYLSGDHPFHLYVQPQYVSAKAVVAATGITENKSLWWIFSLPLPVVY